MKQAPVKLGPLALILTVISICLTILAILSFTTARADLRLAEKYADNVRERYDLEREGQDYLAEVSRTLEKEGAGALTQDEDGIVRHYLYQGESTLDIGLAVEENGWRVVSWRQEQTWEPDLDIGNLWSGE